ncbi:MAG: hypothetical protein ABW219_12645 [Ilumatobacteraceae bacterium]
MIDADGRPIGVVTAVFAADAVCSSAWLGIDAGGLDALDIVFAPTAGARLVGDSVMVAFSRDQVLSTRRDVVAEIAPSIDPVLGPDPTDEPAAPRTVRCSR